MHADVVAKILAVYFARAHRRDSITKVMTVIRHAVCAQNFGLTEALITFVAVGPLQGDMIDKTLTELVDLHIRLSQIESGADAATLHHSQKTRFECFDASQVNPESPEFSEANGNIVGALRGLALCLPSTRSRRNSRTTEI